MEFNRQISNVEPSKSVTLLTKPKELQKIDPEILNLTGGELHWVKNAFEYIAIL